MTLTAAQPRDTLADMTSAVCDSASGPEEVLACFEATEAALNGALSTPLVQAQSLQLSLNATAGPQRPRVVGRS